MLQLYNVVVDNEETGKQLLEKGRLKRRFTIIPLNKIASRSISDDVVKKAQSLVCLVICGVLSSCLMLHVCLCVCVCVCVLCVCVEWLKLYRRIKECGCYVSVQTVSLCFGYRLVGIRSTLQSV